MKELSIEEKAKAYDEALEKAKKWYDTNTNKGYRSIFEDIFPEFNESENIRIRKAIKYGLDYVFTNNTTIFEVTKEQCLAWLEKQVKNNMGISEATKQKLDDNLNKALEKETPESWNEFLNGQGEQKPNTVLDIEIPFGAKDSELQEASYYIPEGFHAEIESNRVVIKRSEQKPADKVEPIFNVGDKIQYLKGCGTIMTIEKIENGEYIFANNMGHTTIERGNKWYLVEQKSAWSEEDESNRTSALMLLRYPITIWNEVNNNTRIKAIDWLKTLKDKYVPQLKQDWSEEDESRRKKIIHILSLDGRIKNEELSDINNWLKSLRPQNTWKPSDEQMDALRYVTNFDYGGHKATLVSLYEQLKKLREK